MPKSLKPTILIIDDEPDDQRARKIEIGNRARVDILHPEEVTLKHLAAADLVLVDFRLDKWSERDNVSSLVLKPMNGLALAAVLRAHADDLKEGSPTAFAIHSGYVSDLSGGLPTESREHAFARAHNLEWVFAKQRTTTRVPLAQQIVSLARAMQQLPSSWPADNMKATEKQIRKLLSLPKGEVWVTRAWEDIEDCHPPIHELSKWSHGLAILHWMLHRILPYPCFLWDTHHLASRFRVTHSSLLEALKRKGKLTKLLNPLRYQGILAEFLGDRWWRSGVEAVIWHATNGNSFDTEAIQSVLSSRSGLKLEPSDADQSVVCIDHNYKPLEGPCAIESAVRIQPDDWPPYADQAWTSIELARDIPMLNALVIHQDRERLG